MLIPVELAPVLGCVQPKCGERRRQNGEHSSDEVDGDMARRTVVEEAEMCSPAALEVGA